MDKEKEIVEPEEEKAVKDVKDDYSVDTVDIQSDDTQINGLDMFAPFLKGELTELPEELQKWIHNCVNKLIIAQAVEAISSMQRQKKLLDYVTACEDFMFQKGDIPKLKEKELQARYKAAATNLFNLQENIRKFCVQNKEIDKPNSPKEQLVIQALNTPIEDLKVLIDQSQREKDMKKNR